MRGSGRFDRFEDQRARPCLFLQNKSTIDDVILVVAANALSRCEALLNADPKLRQRPWRLEPGGDTRQESVLCGLKATKAETEIVVIHDGARPLVSPVLIDRCVEVARQEGAAIAGVP